MILVTLSGGNIGGQEVEWTEGEETMIFDGYRYRLIDSVAIYEGLDQA